MSMTINGTSGLTFNDGSTQPTAANGNLGFRNRIINGAMMIDQRNAGASVAFTNGFYAVDRFVVAKSSTAVGTLQQSTTVPAGFKNSLVATCTTGATPSAAEYNMIWHMIEGLNVADLNWGTANASAVTLGFWVRSSLTGTFAGALANSGYTRGYVFTYTISAANTWEYKTVTIAGDTTGTWLTDNGVGIRVTFDLGTGSNNQGTAGSWSGTVKYSVAGAQQVMATTGATFYITGVQLEKGSTATSFDYRPYGTELQLCQRYTRTFGDGISGIASSAAIVMFNYAFEQPMRASPTVSITDTSIQVSNQFANDFTSSGSTILASNISSVGGRVNATGFTGLTQGVYYSAFGNTNGSFFLLSAEL